MLALRTRRTALLLSSTALIAGLGLAACGGGGGNSGTPVSTDPTGSNAVTALKVLDTTTGTGAQADTTKNVSVNYTGYLYDVRVANTKGTQFDTSVGKAPLTFTLGANQVIPGFDQGVTGMKVGGKRTVTIPSGNAIPVRVTQTLDSATAQEGQTFSGTITSDIVIDGIVAIPSGSSVSGRVDAVQEAAHFKGASLLTVSLSSLSRRGDRLPISTDPYTVEGKGRGKNTAEKAGGGAAVGAILDGIFGGGKGAAIGAATGGGLGAGANAVTRGQQVQIPSETVVRFRLASPVTVRVRTDAGSGDHRDNRYNDRDNNNSDPALQRRPN